MTRALAIAVCVAGCYSGTRATRDVNQAWRGRARAELEARWGPPAEAREQAGGLALRWSHTRHHVTLPSGSASLSAGPEGLDATVAVQPGEVWTSRVDVIASVDARGVVVGVEGPSLRWGAPGDANLRWGTILGLSAGLGRLDDTGTPLPSGGGYLGGMISPTLGLVGAFQLAAGSGDGGGAMGLSAGVAAQWWPAARVWLRGGPALVLAFDPGFEEPTLGPGAAGGASVAIVRAGSFVLDLRIDVTVAASAVFGSAGVGVNLN